MGEPESLASIGQIACQQVGGDDGLASAGGKLHHYARFFRIEDFLDLFEQIALVVTKFKSSAIHRNLGAYRSNISRTEQLNPGSAAPPFSVSSSPSMTSGGVWAMHSHRSRIGVHHPHQPGVVAQPHPRLLDHIGRSIAG